MLNEGAEAAPFFPVNKNRDAVARVQLDDLHGSSAAIARASVPRVAKQYKVGGIWLPTNNTCATPPDVKSADMTSHGPGAPSEVGRVGQQGITGE